ncbi:MAG TPA: hypothetical protein VOA41_21420 [Candidatus Dormibacteraeota bacterium]|nr:hypothetical protein [Candidatus Dormibacteraeota bacterium]
MRRGDAKWLGARPLTYFIACAFLLLATCAGASPQEPTSGARLLTPGEGEAIIDAVSQHGEQVAGRPDCSHLVHEIYILAGFPYSYGNSFDLYSGSDNFARVKTTQPGDLIVWPGHVGIVLDPVQHTFYSSVRVGLQAESYNGSYWRHRGKPRFYRYVVGSSSGAVTTAQSTHRNPPKPEQILTLPVIKERSDARHSSLKRSRKDVSERARVVERPAPEETATTVQVPQSILIATAQREPTRDEVANGISELSDAAGTLLRMGNLSELRLPVVIFDRLDVERVEIKHNRGWAHTRIHSRVFIAHGEVDSKRRTEQIRWGLRHTDSGWSALTPQGRAYVPRDVAVNILAAQLVKLGQSGGAMNHAEGVLRREGQLASILNSLLQK